MEYRAEQNVSLTAEQIFAIISDVESYQEFLPWCQGSRLVETLSTDRHIGLLLIGFQHFKEKFYSEVVVDRKNLRVEMRVPIECDNPKYRKGNNAVKQLYAYWQLTPSNDGAETEAETITNVQFYIEFRMKLKLYDQILSLMMKDTIGKMAEAFIVRAKKLR
ncbi:MAG: type II toxin-antitoxin system RatA family toxin [Alphaproteobacteria bacterium]|nr:type II toxin-antitoxin system RatA family toxin [Alphaproteobacteria bacterium]